jgi:hypothetical protein
MKRRLVQRPAAFFAFKKAHSAELMPRWHVLRLAEAAHGASSTRDKSGTQRNDVTGY